MAFYDDDLNDDLEKEKYPAPKLGLGNLPITPITDDTGNSYQRPGDIANVPSLNDTGRVPTSYKEALGNLGPQSAANSQTGENLQQVAQPPDVTPQVKKPSFLEKIFGIDRPTYDEYGLQVPHGPQTSKLGKLIGLGLGGLLGGLSGAGPLTGAGAAGSTLTGLDQKNYLSQLENYQKNRALKEREKYGNEVNRIREQQAANTKSYRDLITKIAQQRANTEAARTKIYGERASKEGGNEGGKEMKDINYFTSLKDKLKRGEPLSEAQLIFLKNYQAKLDKKSGNEEDEDIKF